MHICFKGVSSTTNRDFWVWIFEAAAAAGCTATARYGHSRISEGTGLNGTWLVSVPDIWRNGFSAMGNLVITLYISCRESRMKLLHFANYYWKGGQATQYIYILYTQNSLPMPWPQLEHF